jgi:hypothetical protein
MSLALAIGAIAVSPGCQTTPATEGGAPMCTYLEEIDCGPEEKKCRATCLPDLSAYGPCICPDAGTDNGDGGEKDAR